MGREAQCFVTIMLVELTGIGRNFIPFALEGKLSQFALSEKIHKLK